MNAPLTEFPDDLEVKVIATMGGYGEGVYFQHGDYLYEMSLHTRFETPVVTNELYLSCNVKNGDYYYVSDEEREKLGNTLGEVRQALREMLVKFEDRFRKLLVKMKKEPIDQDSELRSLDEKGLHDQINYAMATFFLHEPLDNKEQLEYRCRSVRQHIRKLLDLPNVQACESVVARIKKMIPALRALDITNPVLSYTDGFDPKADYFIP